MTYKDFFEPQLIEEAWNKYAEEWSTPFLCRMPPVLFLSLAQHRINPVALEALPRPDKGGPKWNSLPALAIGGAPDMAKVIDHDGRHRAIYMITQGVEEIIVLIHSNMTAKEMGHKVVNEDGQMCYSIPPTIIQARSGIFPEPFEPYPWADPAFGHALTKSMHQVYFREGRDYIE